jgi:hypothetical protein
MHGDKLWILGWHLNYSHQITRNKPYFMEHGAILKVKKTLYYVRAHMFTKHYEASLTIGMRILLSKYSKLSR